MTTSDFEALVLTELSRAWSRASSFFDWTSSGISVPIFKLIDRKDRLAQYEPDAHTISFDRTFATKRSWAEVFEVLKHEMAHQYVHEVLKIDNEKPHGPAFQSVCKQYKIDRFGRGEEAVSATHHIVEKVRHLLALAQSDNENEARLAAETARSLMLKYNIDMQERNEEQGYTVRYVGGVVGRIQAYMTELSNILNKFYFVQQIWMPSFDPRTKKKGHELELSGTEDNVSAAEYVYDFISRAAVSAWERKFADPLFKIELDLGFAKTFQSWGTGSTKGYVLSARSNFLLGFIRGFKSQLEVAEVKEKEAGLVLATDPLLEEFYRTRHPRIIHAKNPGAKYNQAMRDQGFNEGKSLTLNPGVQAPKNYVPLLNK